jgi:hypothetical protein
MVDFDEDVILKMRARRKTTGNSVADREKAEHRAFTTKKPKRNKTGRTVLLGIRVTQDMKDWFTVESNERNLMLVELLEEMVSTYRKKKRRSE